ncbi:SRPBCC domain-containing protein [Telluria mixta]|uniref:SRPBCC domain-containing protein n=1 Tax=Telluria mixta TaxID=34071 RepID=A0ABT2BZ70_9BURK|nr:SRPBCC domain-containing protein [Telluria mixta]MCS0630445.1 SRPBCC domain-containing protein [Telluria mixta]WEM94251.1 SRPBCC domain-containing protein [Telluria mixta]
MDAALQRWVVNMALMGYILRMHLIEKTVVVAAPPATVWDALTDPAAMRMWMGEPDMAIEVATDWRPGSPIVISGEHHGAFRNHGIVLDAVPGALLRYTHLSSVSALADLPEHYSVIAFALDAVDGGTAVRLTVERFATEAIYRHLNLYWRGTLDVFKAFVERRPIMSP